MMQRRFSTRSYCTSSIWVITLLLIPFLSFGHAEIQDFTNCQPSDERRLASEFVSAYTSRLEAGWTCETNVTSASQQDVHVIVVNLTDGADGAVQSKPVVHLDLLSRRHNTLKNPPGTDYQESHLPVVFVLLASVPVRWKVTPTLSQLQGKHLFLISRDSSIRVRKRRYYRTLVKWRRRPLPKMADYQNVLRWAQRRFGGVTSFSEIFAPTVRFYTGRDVNAESQCQVGNMIPSHRIFSSHQDAEPINGCVSIGKKYSWNKSVYILELMEIPKPTQGVTEISLEILPDDTDTYDYANTYGLSMRDGSNSHNNDPRLYLVVKSPVDLKWSLHSSKMSGWIDIVTDADINLDDLKLSTIALRREELSQSGQDLVKWTKEILADVQMYAGIRSANVIQLRIPPRVLKKSLAPSGRQGNRAGKSHDQPWRNPWEGDWTTPNDRQDTTEDFADMIKTKCASGHMEVSIAKSFIEASQVDKTKISLKDSSCRMSRETDKHIILRSGLDECGTQLLEMDNLLSYSNKVLLWTTPSLVQNFLQDLGSGNFEDNEMGSGARDMGSYMDDEDFQTRRLALEVECKVYKDPLEDKLDSTSHSLVGRVDNNNIRPQCELNLYTNFFFLRPHTNFPMTVTKDSIIYVKASVTNKDVSLIADACWLSSSHLPHSKTPHRKQLISQGCESAPTVQWLDDPMDAPIGTDLKTTKFRFQLGKEFPGDKSSFYLHCQFRTCHRDNFDSVAKCSIDSTERCKQMKEHSARHASGNSNADCGPVTVGPIEMTDTEVNVKRPGTQDDAAASAQGEDSKGQQRHQRIIIEGLDSPTVVGIAFAAFIIGIILVGALWFIHSHTGPIKTAVTSQTNVNASGDLTPNSSSPMTA